jgi:hypothetical protein
MTKEFIGLTEDDVVKSQPYSITRDKGCFHAGAKWAENKLREKNTKVWPKHKPETTLHEIILDGVARDFTAEQIKEETLGLADSKMIWFYRDSFNARMELDYQYRKGYERGLSSYKEIEARYYALLKFLADEQRIADYSKPITIILKEDND